MKNYFNLNISRTVRHTGYLFWTLVSQMVDSGISRVVFYPLLVYLIGKEEFGVFAIAQSVVLIIGASPGDGLMTGLLRHTAQYPKERHNQFYHTAMRLDHMAMVIIVALGLAVIGILWQTTLVPHQLLKCLIPLVISLYTENQFMLVLTELRYNREFRTGALWYSLKSSGAVLAGLAGAVLYGVVGAAWGYSAGLISAYIVLRLRRNYWMKTSYNVEMAKVLKAVWLHIVVAGIIASSGPYLNRIFLSISHGFANVAELVAATSVLTIFTMLIANFGSMVLSIISKYRSAMEISNQVKMQYLALTGAAILVTPVITIFFGPLLLKFMFPAIFEDSLKLFYIVLWSLPFLILTQLMRPIVLKFASVKITPIINGLSLVGTILSTVTLVPKYRAVGAAWAIVLGTTVGGLLWCAAALRVLLVKSSVESRESLNEVEFPEKIY